ncbi:hypothetical protein JMJ77_0007595 [Colletotrichum scovillei]|uniref:Uncharacterized protein n=1 Tax=Colletotrichum scovillei TaxID=1209932 RepID=A0A9P7RD59_9PEZI|nr:hypothetical protein JMJ77_0007595 [Colletotrichum scovillei]KAG7074607.1 hypothetical protein JMJ76_0011083 [Colletotrichum scovillei]KAG7081665.1 hypothetical protein JMJ78_0003783 [Colletotrichum scovillei]
MPIRSGSYWSGQSALPGNLGWTDEYETLEAFKQHALRIHAREMLGNACRVE